MRVADIRILRALIEEGLSDAEIADVLAEGAGDAEEEERLYGRPNTDEDYGRRPNECDEYYQRNDAGEFVNLM